MKFRRKYGKSPRKNDPSPFTFGIGVKWSPFVFMDKDTAKVMNELEGYERFRRVKKNG